MDTAQRLRSLGFHSICYVGVLAYSILRLCWFVFCLFARLGLLLQEWHHQVLLKGENSDDFINSLTAALYRIFRLCFWLAWFLVQQLWQAMTPIRHFCDRLWGPALTPLRNGFEQPLISLVHDVRIQAKPSPLTFHLGIGALAMMATLSTQRAVARGQQ